MVLMSRRGAVKGVEVNFFAPRGSGEWLKLGVCAAKPDAVALSCCDDMPQCNFASCLGHGCFKPEVCMQFLATGRKMQQGSHCQMPEQVGCQL